MNEPMTPKEPRNEVQDEFQKKIAQQFAEFSHKLKADNDKNTDRFEAVTTALESIVSSISELKQDRKELELARAQAQALAHIKEQNEQMELANESGPHPKRPKHIEEKPKSGGPSGSGTAPRGSNREGGVDTENRPKLGIASGSGMDDRGSYRASGDNHERRGVASGSGMGARGSKRNSGIHTMNHGSKTNEAKWIRFSNESRVDCIIRHLDEARNDPNIIRDVIHHVNLRTSRDLQQLKAKTVKITYEENTHISFKPCSFYQNGSCHQEVTCGVHLDAKSTKKAYVHACPVCLRQFKGAFQHSLTNCPLLQELDEIEYNVQYNPKLVAVPKPKDDNSVNEIVAIDDTNEDEHDYSILDE